MSNKKIIRAGDAKSWVSCRRRAWFDHYPPEGFEASEDPFEALIQGAGLVHEERARSGFDAVVLAQSPEHTRELIESGVPVIYQPDLISDELGVRGRPDFLVRAADGTYQVQDAKLATSLSRHKEIQIQLALYRRLAQSPLPALAYLGDGSTQELGDEADGLVDEFLAGMKELLNSPEVPPASFSNSRCGACPYNPACRPNFESAHDLTLLYGLDSRSAPGLRAAGIPDIRALAASEPSAVPEVSYLKSLDSRTRAVLQARSHLTGGIYTRAPVTLPNGTWVHFDIEANPLSDSLGEEVYLWGLLPPPYDRDSYRFTWSDAGIEEDRLAWTGFLEMVRELRKTHPDLILAHYANYERQKLALYAQRYDMMDDETVAWLLSDEGSLFDLNKAVSKSLVLPVLGYGLKDICKDPRLVNYKWELAESGSQWSVVRYVDYLRASDPNERAEIKSEILTYNRDDVRASRALEQWLLTIGCEKFD